MGYCFRRAVEKRIPRAIETVDHTNLTLALALHAGAMGVPFMPTYSTLGSDLLKRNGNLREFASPVNEERLVAVRALRPDVAIVNVQRADAAGNAHLWGSLGVAIDGARASRKVIVVAEEIVAPEVIASDPNRTLIPGFLVAAVVHEPGGAHPAPVQGYYGRDHAFFQEYHDQTRELDGFERWIKHWVSEVPSRDAYLKRVGEARLQSLRVREHALSVPADFGF
jgi:glutaconate CoA-transferase subunit A